MRKNAFTLIELLAVIVILAIIALIAVPIVINIINDSKIESQKRSIDMYAKALQQSIEKYLMTNPNENKDIIEKLHNKDLIDYKGDRVECNVEWINDDGSLYLEGCKVNGVEIKDYTCGIDKRPATIKLLSKTNPIEITNYTDGNIHEMYTFYHEATDQTPELTDYRYIGDDPYNYVEFNNETWRIIGIFETEAEDGKKDKRIKLIKNEKLPQKKAWTSQGKDWATSSLNIYLNNEYLNILNDKSKGMIENVKYYLGSSERYYSLTAKDYYDFERGNLVENYNSLNTFNSIALMYPSDYVYTFGYSVDNKCFGHAFICSLTNGSMKTAYYSSGSKSFSRGGTPKKSWIHNMLYVDMNNSNIFYTWTISTVLSTGLVANVFDIFVNGDVYNAGQCCGNFSHNEYAINPVLYLKSNVKIESGDGTKDNPYKFN